MLLSCRPGGGNKNRLLIYTPHGQDLLRDFVARYKQQYPDVDVQFLDMGSREILERVRAERNRPQADLWWGAAHTTFQTAAEENLLARVSPDAGPTRFRHSAATPGPLVRNLRNAGSDRLQQRRGQARKRRRSDWDDVLDPKWRDKVLIRNPNPSDSMRAIFGAMIWRFYKDTGSPDKGYDWLRKLDANVHEYTADGTLLMQKLVRREGLDHAYGTCRTFGFTKSRKDFPVGYRVSGQRHAGDHRRHRDRSRRRQMRKRRNAFMSL